MKKAIAYWTATSFVCVIMTISGLLAALHHPRMMTALAHLGYPKYFANLLGTGKLIGVIVLLVPGIPKLKEWAYVAFGITVLSGAYSHLLSGDGLMALDPLGDVRSTGRLVPDASRRSKTYSPPSAQITTAFFTRASKEYRRMKLLILGATGGIGFETVRQAIDRGHFVTAFVRSPDRLKPFAGRIAVQQGDLLKSTELESSVAGHDAVLSGFGPRLPIAKSDANLLGNFAAALTPAMQRAGVRRLVIVSTAFLFRDSIVPPTYLFGRLFFPGVVRDATRMEQIVMSSNLDWTIVRPPQLTDNPYTGRYRVQAGHLPRFGFNISRADVADSLLRAAEDPSTARTILGVSN